tara:strand:- start:597 stop:1289 length:693 start_codon:yes stop_codon:yes gene_type:complete
MKTIFVTGDRKGIGRDISEYYLHKGYNVVGCSRNGSDLNHSNYLHVIGDVSKENEVKNIVRQGLKKFKNLDILINNAGKASLNHSLLTPLNSVKEIFNVNFLGSFLFSRECAKAMIKSKKGRIVNFSTVAVPMNLEGELVYSSSKAAIEQMTKVMSKELSNFNITVNTIGPSPVQTDLIKTVPKEKIIEIINKQTIKRMGKFEDVINLINFFISDKSSFITGQTVYLGGL